LELMVFKKIFDDEESKARIRESVREEKEE
jgi:hypothetical protein